MTATTGVSFESAIESVDVSAYTVPTDAPESDGTLEWDSTTIVVVEVDAGGVTGLGYTYGAAAIGTLIESKLADVVARLDAMDPQAAWAAMSRALRNNGEPGHRSMAISAVDVALWDLKARLLGATAGQAARPLRATHVPIYGSGGFTSLLRRAAARAVRGLGRERDPAREDEGRPRPGRDPRRVRVARESIGSAAELFVDANGAYSRKQALELGERFASDADVCWFEEPVSSDDLEGLRLLRDRAPAGMADRRGRVRLRAAATSRACSRPARSTCCRPT